MHAGTSLQEVRRKKSTVASDVPHLSQLTWPRFFYANLLPVTIGNVIGGGLMVGAIYWFVYLRAPRAATAEVPASRGAIAD